MIAIVKGCGTNIASIQFALERLGQKSLLTDDAKQIQAASHVILPGVGVAKHAMRQLEQLHLLEVIHALKQPVLGICLGMQLLYEYSQEGEVPCLGILPGTINALRPREGLTLPHMGWNQLQIQQPQSPLILGIENRNYVYFVHGYAAPINQFSVATTQHGDTFTAIVQRNNFCGIQFHPERSGLLGEKILSNFLTLN